MKLYKGLICLLGLTLGVIATLMAQSSTDLQQSKRSSKAWEIGVGGTGLQFNRVQFSNFEQLQNGAYNFDLGLRNTIFGGNLYVAREVNPYLYFDIQGNVGYAVNRASKPKKQDWMFMVQPGLQWRLSEYFESKYVEPYLRVGVGYIYKTFDMVYVGTEGLTGNAMQWVLDSYGNKNETDRDHLFPISAGAGVNMWMSDSFGLGMQADYIVMPHNNISNSFQGTVRLMWRMGGKSKKPAVTMVSVPPQYIEIEKIVEKEVVVEIERIVTVMADEMLIDLFSNLSFEFDKAILSDESEEILDNVADILKQFDNKKYLITGYTDAKGPSFYNEVLSQKRAKTVIDALVERGVPTTIIKARGVGKRVAYAGENTSNNMRAADRKVTIEVISNDEFWNYIP